VPGAYEEPKLFTEELRSGFRYLLKFPEDFGACFAPILSLAHYTHFSTPGSARSGINSTQMLVRARSASLQERAR
jgi:hypothetical protein